MITKVDTSSIFHFAMMNKNYMNTYRLSVTLKEEIDPIILQEVVNELLPKFPTICSKVHKDNFWFYLKSLKQLNIKKDEQKVLSTINIQSIYDQAMNILYKDNTISLEAFHVVSDGHGAFVYIKDLVQNYIYKKYSLNEIQNKNEITIEEMIEDGYEMIVNQSFQSKLKPSFKPYSFPIKEKAKQVKVTTFKLSVENAKLLSKKYECNITELLMGIFYHSILQMRKNNKDVVLAIPIDLRRLFKTKSLKNFILLANVCVKDAHKEITLKELIIKLQEEMKLQNNEHFLGTQAKKLGRLSQSITMKICPTFIKTSLIRFANHFVGNNACMTLSNLGRIQFDDPQIHDYIESMDAILSPKTNGLYNCAVIAINDNIHVNITHDHLNNHLIEMIKEELKQLELSFIEKEYGY